MNSSRLPDKDQKKNSEMLSGDEPLQAQAAKMDSRNRNRAIHYEGGVTMWQGANRIQAEAIDVDREKHSLVADRNVVTNLWEEPNDQPGKPTAAPVLTVVHAPHLVYTEQNRLAVYTGGVQLVRPGLQVKGRELRAVLAEAGADSRLEKAFADGTVEILQSSKDLTRNGAGEHAEFYTGDQRVILRAPRARLTQTPVTGKPSTSEGAELTYFANDDRLLVIGAPNEPASSRINPSKKK